jgi:ABC-type transport system involved in multi-copper enzyme maturation permease subunit
MTGEGWRRPAVIFFMFLVSLSVFFCLGLLVSSLTARSSTSLIVLLFLWCVWGMVVPKASVIIAGMLRPIPSQNEIYTQKALSSNEVSQELAPRQQALMEQFNVKMIPMDGNRYRIEGDYQGYQAALSELNVERARLVAEKSAKIDSDYQLKKAAQASLAKNLSRISPASALTFSATALARTGVDDYNRFLKAMLDYKPVMSNWLRTSPDIRNEKGGYKEIDPVTLGGMPRPAIAHDNLVVTVVRVLPDLIAMFVMIVILTGGAYFAFIRCDVR